jgi:hypothetical protein
MNINNKQRIFTYCIFFFSAGHQYDRQSRSSYSTKAEQRDPYLDVSNIHQILKATLYLYYDE